MSRSTKLPTNYIFIFFAIILLYTCSTKKTTSLQNSESLEQVEKTQPLPLDFGDPLSEGIRFVQQVLPGTAGKYSSITVGPDRRLYAISVDGLIKRFAINDDGSMGQPEEIYSLQDAYGVRMPRLAIGFCFDPESSEKSLVAYVSHSTLTFSGGPEWDGKITRLSGSNLEKAEEIVVNLPRSYKDHLTNSMAFGPDCALYFTQGSNTAMGKPDKTWGFREESFLSGAVLRLDLNLLEKHHLPLDVKTSDGGGRYNPLSSGAPLTIFATGLRNSYDLLWHSNGELYIPTNGSAPGGNLPATIQGRKRLDGSTYSGPGVSSIDNIKQVQKDYLFRVEKGGYYGHPNPIRGEFVMNGGNPTASPDSAQVDQYPVGTLPDKNWRGYTFEFSINNSPNGIIEYKSDSFNGLLKGKILIARFVNNKDIIVLVPGGKEGDITGATEGINIQGFSGFNVPLDLTEDTLTGNIYVAEFGGEGSIKLLKPVSEIQEFASK